MATPRVPEPEDTTDLRLGPEIDPALLEVLPLVGRWAGFGTGARPGSGEAFDYAQRVDLAHDGRPFLTYRSRTWLLDEDGTVLRPEFGESGFLRPGADEDELELLLATADGAVEVFTGLAGDRRWEFATTAVGFSPSAVQLAGERRLYALTTRDGAEALVYVQELAPTPAQYQPYLNGTLWRERAAPDQPAGNGPGTE